MERRRESGLLLLQLLIFDISLLSDNLKHLFQCQVNDIYMCCPVFSHILAYCPSDTF